MARSLTAPRARVGTPGYMAPEQAKREVAEPSVDLYALGVVCFEMFTGHAPFEAESRGELYMAHAYTEPPAFAQLAPDLEIDGAVEGLVQRLLAKEPSDRPPDARSVERVLAGRRRELDAAQPESFARAQRQASPATDSHLAISPWNRWIVAGMALAVVLAGLAAALLVGS